MKLSEFKELAKQQLSYMLEDGFKIQHIDSCIILNRKTKNGNEKIEIFYLKNYGFVFDINPPCCAKRFDEVETHLVEVFTRATLNRQHTIANFANENYVPAGLEWWRNEGADMIRFNFKKEETMMLYFDYVKAYYYNEVLPFFTKYNSVETVYNQIAGQLKKLDFNIMSYDYETLIGFLNPEGSRKPSFRIIILLHLFSNELFQEYYNSVLNDITKYVDETGSIFEIEYRDALIQLYDNLKTVPRFK